MKTLKKIALGVVCASAFALAACGSDDAATDTASSATNSVSNSATDSAPSAETTNVVKVMTYAEYVAAEDGDDVCVDAYVTGKQSWWNNQAVVYLADDNGAYLAYNLVCTQEQYNTELAVGNKIEVTGEKTSYNGQVEVMNGTYKLLSGTKTYAAKEIAVTEMANYPTQLVTIKNLTVVSMDTSAEDIAAGKDLYYTVKADGADTTYQFAVESYLTDSSTDTYKAVAALAAGTVINVTGYVYYWYTPQIQTTSVKVLEK